MASDTTHVIVLMGAFFIGQCVSPAHLAVVIQSDRFGDMALWVVFLAEGIDGVCGLSHFPNEVLFHGAALDELWFFARCSFDLEARLTKSRAQS